MSGTGRHCAYILDPTDPETWGGHEQDECYMDAALLNEDDVWSCPHEAADGADRCLFHLPVGEKDDSAVIEALHALVDDAPTHDNAAPQDAVELLGARFGTFDLREAPQDIAVDAPIWLTHATVEGHLEWAGATIAADSLCLRGLQCDRNATFSEATFDAPVYFEGAKFDSQAQFRHAEFTAEADFEAVTFASGAGFQFADFADATFYHTAFRDETAFVNAEFSGDAKFAHASFVGETQFVHTTFAGDQTLFGQAEFGGEVLFRQADFHGDDHAFVGAAFDERANFGGVEFSGGANFARAEFDGEAVFLNATFSDEIDFGRTEFADQVDFSRLDLSDGRFAGADMTDAVCIDTCFWNADFEQALLSRATLFGADLRGAKLSGAVVGDLRIDDETQFLGPATTEATHSEHSLAALWAKPRCVYDPQFESDAAETDITKAKGVYRALEELAGKAARPRLQSQCFVRRQDLHTEQYKQATREATSAPEAVIAGARYCRAKVARMTLLYGESPWRVMGGSVGFILMISLLYPLGGWLQPTGDAPLTYTRIVDSPELYFDSLYFSTLTFTTLGMGDYEPLGFGQVLATANTAFGAILVALLVFVLGRRAAR